MSGGLDILAMKEDDVTKMLAAGVHLGDSNVNYQMEQYIYKVRNDGTPIFNLKKTWEKLMLAARVIASIENPADICAISSGTIGQRAILKFARYTGTVAVAGRFTPGTFTNQIQKAFREPRLLVLSDPVGDHQPITEASYVNLPVVAFCNSNAPLRFIDIAIPCNNNGKHSIGLMWWLLTREVLRLKGAISREVPWEVVPDLFFYRDPEEVDEQAKQEQQEQEVVASGDQWGGVGGDADEWGGETTTATTTAAAPSGGKGDWPSEGMGTGAPSTSGPPVPTPGGFLGSSADQDWNVDNTTATKDWAEDNAGEWGGDASVTAGKW